MWEITFSTPRNQKVIGVGVRVMVQPASKPGDPSENPDSHMVKGEN